jgi:opacity protein-like surface antigen
MQWKSIFVSILASLFVSVSVPARSQVAHSASEGRLPLTVGFGVSDYFLDWGNSRNMVGITAWADWRLQHMPWFLNGIGIEVEGHHIAYNRPTELVRMQQDSGLGGVNYQWRHYDRVQPYGKALAGFGSIDFPPFPKSNYSHDTRTILAMGAGADIHAWRRVSVRADYEYQFWRHIFGPNDLNPNGFTVGAVYDFGRRNY